MGNQHLAARIAAPAINPFPGLAKFNAVSDGSIVRVLLLAGGVNSGGPATFDLKIDGVSSGQSIQIAAGQSSLFKSIPRGTVLVVEGQSITLDLTAVPAGGVIGPLWIQVVLDDRITHQKWVKDLYVNTVLAQPSNAEMTAAVNSLNAAQTPLGIRSAALSVAATAFGDARYTGRARTDVQYVEDLYLSVLGRPSDAGGHAFWLSQLNTQGGTKTRAQLRDAQVLSIESINERLNQMFPGSLPTGDAVHFSGIPLLIGQPSEDDVWAFSSASNRYVLRPRSGSGGGGVGGGFREVSERQTGLLNNDSEETGVVALGKSFILVQVDVSAPARVRLYSNADSRAADAARPFGTLPAVGTQHGVLCDLLLNGSTGLSWVMSPPALCSNVETLLTSSIPYAIQNLSGGPAQISVTFTFVGLEGTMA